MCERASISLTPHPTSPAAARRFVADHCRAWAVPADVAGGAVLLTSELVTNAVLHARTTIAVTFSLSQSVLEVGVADRESHRPVTRPQHFPQLDDIATVRAPAGAPDAVPDDRAAGWNTDPDGPITAGRGLVILAAMADTWGVADYRDGKEVWFTLTAAGTPASDCPCRDNPGYRVASGRRVMTRGQA